MERVDLGLVFVGGKYRNSPWVPVAMALARQGPEESTRIRNRVDVCELLLRERELALERLRVEVEGRRPVGALEDRVALLFLLLQLLSLLVNVLGLLVVGRQPQDLECEEKVSNLRI